MTKTIKKHLFNFLSFCFSILKLKPDQKFTIYEFLSPFLRFLLPFKFKKPTYKNTFLINDRHPNSENFQLSEENTFQERVFCFWTGNNPITENRQRCIDVLKKTLEIPLILVTPKNLNDYVLEGHPLHPAYEYLSLIHRSDYLRGYFMHHYGGGYTDIKENRHAWEKAFKQLKKSKKWALGYTEIAPSTVAFPKLNNSILNEDLRLNFFRLVGNCSYICKPKTPFTFDWHTQQNNFLDYKFEELKAHPATDIFGKSEDYPIAWSEILGQIFHPVCLKYHNKFLYSNSIKSVYKNYR